MIQCEFELNGKPLSDLRCGPLSMAAFSGFGRHVNRREDVCLAGVGAIPPGIYYIIDRQSGGLLGAFRDLFNGHKDWFALYANDGKIDDVMYCADVRRGNFRLHPKGALGISKGCITINFHADFHRLRRMLKTTACSTVPGADLKAYGTILVK